MNKALENLLTRRSCRKYDPAKQVPAKKLDEILLAGAYAPTGKGQQSPIMVAVQNAEELAYVQKLNARVMGKEDAPTFYGAPTVIVVFGDKNSPFCLDDGNLVMANLLNAANAVGVDSCYIWRAREAFATEEGKSLMKKWGVPENYIGIGNVILGFGLEGGKREPAPRKDNYVIKVL